MTRAIAPGLLARIHTPQCLGKPVAADSPQTSDDSSNTFVRVSRASAPDSPKVALRLPMFAAKWPGNTQPGQLAPPGSTRQKSGFPLSRPCGFINTTALLAIKPSGCYANSNFPEGTSGESGCCTSTNRPLHGNADFGGAAAKDDAFLSVGCSLDDAQRDFQSARRNPVKRIP